MKQAIVGVLACALALAFVACAWMGVTSRHEGDWKTATIVRVEGPVGGGATNLSLGHMRWSTSSAEGNAGALLVRDGDLLFVNLEGKGAGAKGEFIVPWRSEDGVKLALRSDGPRLVLGEQTVSLALGKDAAGWDWVAKASEKELAGLRFIMVEDAPSDDQVGVFEKIARANPHVGLALTDVALLARVASLDPRWLMLDKKGIPQAALDMLTKRKAMETLILSLEDADVKLQGLAEMPNLRRLTLVKYDSAKTAMPDLPRLESLTFFDSTFQDLTPLKRLTGLGELNFTLAEVGSFNGIEALPQLRELGVYCIGKDRGPVDCAPLDGLKRLRWVALGPGISSEQFARVVQTHPDLRVVELLNCEEIKSPAPLATLHDLKALVFLPKDKNAATETIKQMKQLRLLVLPEDTFKEKSGDVARLRAELPDCAIAAGKPICLGSGRILLLVPVVALGWVLCARRRKSAA